MIKTLFVGPVSGFASPNVVSKGILRALIQNGMYVSVADTTWDGSFDHTEPFFKQHNNRIRWLKRHEMSDVILSGNIAEDYGNTCIVINPSLELFKIKRSGIKIAGMHVGDVDVIPEKWKQAMGQEDVVLVPSKWCEHIVQSSGIETPTIVINHGVSEIFQPGSPLDAPSHDDQQSPLVLLHACAAVFYPERKATPAVFDAFEELIKAGFNVRMKVVFGLNTKRIQELLDKRSEHAEARMDLIWHQGNRSQYEIAELYRGVHALLSPSRAEGFGIMPLEARACGIPVIQTFCTGHADHFKNGSDPMSHGVVPVPHGGFTEGWSRYGKAPAVSVEAIFDAVVTCIANYDELRADALARAAKVLDEWAWPNVTKPLIQWIESTS